MTTLFLLQGGKPIMKKMITILICLVIFASSSQAVIFTTIEMRDYYDFLIIAPDNFSSELEQLKDHKDSYGVKTQIVTLNEIYDSVYFEADGRDDAEKIKYFIKNAIENWGVGYVMLVGGKEIMPVRFVENIYGRHYHYFITDLYFADIYDKNGSFCSWDSNENDVFGELNASNVIDDVDLYPDICIGRIPCSNISELQVVIEKIINYEQNTYEKDWFKRIVLFGGDSQPSFLEFIYPLMGLRLGFIAFEGEYVGNKISKILTDFEAIKIYASGLFRPNVKFLTNKNTNDAINEGAGFVLFSGHGNPDKIWSHLPFTSGMRYRFPYPSGYTIDEIKNLTNIDKLPVVVLSACSCGDFDYIPNPLAWEFLKYENGGSVACIANTNPSYLIPSTLCTDTVLGHLTMSFYKAYSEGIDILGDIWEETIVRYMNDKTAWDLTPLNWKIYNASVMTLEVWTIFGDPTLKIGGYPQSDFLGLKIS
jgi:hypothetical protein